MLLHGAKPRLCVIAFLSALCDALSSSGYWSHDNALAACHGHHRPACRQISVPIPRRHHLHSGHAAPCHRVCLVASDARRFAGMADGCHAGTLRSRIRIVPDAEQCHVGEFGTNTSQRRRKRNARHGTRNRSDRGHHTGSPYAAVVHRRATSVGMPCGWHSDGYCCSHCEQYAT